MPDETGGSGPETRPGLRQQEDGNTPREAAPPAVVLASLPGQWRAEAAATSPGRADLADISDARRLTYATALLDCARELDEVLSISPRGCWEHPGVMGYQHPECGFCWHGKDGLDVPAAGQGANREPRCPRCALAELENAVTWGTSCTSCAAVLDSSIRDHERAERAEEKLAQVTSGDRVSVSRDQLADALTRLDVRVLTGGPAAGMINAESMADAIMEALAAAEVTR